jgi:hypothetical protein
MHEKFQLLRRDLRSRLRRIKTFESLRAAKFHFASLTALQLRHLLGNAVNIAPSQQDFTGRNTEYRSARKQAFETTHRSRIAAFLVERHHHALIRDIKVDIGRGQPVAGSARMAAGMRIDACGLFSRHEQGPRLMNFVNLQAAAARVRGMPQAMISIQ